MKRRISEAVNILRAARGKKKPKPRWGDLPTNQRVAAVGAAGTALIGELVGYEVEKIRSDKVSFLDPTGGEPWQEACVGAAAGAAIRWHFGADARKSAGAELTEKLADVFDVGGGSIGDGLLPVARFLAEQPDDVLFRGVFLHLASIAFDSRYRVLKVRAMCQRAAEDAMSKHHQRARA